MNEQYRLVWARPSDIDEIMRIEDAAFPEGIREGPETFLGRLRVFPQGNTVLLEDQKQFREKDRRLAGYFCSELWTDVPPAEAGYYHLGHSIGDRQRESGSVLYISSYAAAPGIKGAGRYLFTASLELVCAANPQVKTFLLLVNSLWAPARHIYETEGFVYTGKLDAFFSGTGQDGKTVRSDGLLMRKDLWGSAD